LKLGTLSNYQIANSERPSRHLSPSRGDWTEYPLGVCRLPVGC